MFNNFRDCFTSFFGKVSAKELFEEFDEDLDHYLNEDEQLLIFTVINSKLHSMYQELIFFGAYQKLRDL